MTIRIYLKNIYHKTESDIQEIKNKDNTDLKKEKNRYF